MLLQATDLSDAVASHWSQWFWNKPCDLSDQSLQAYVMAHETEDYLVDKNRSQKANPFREKSSCELI